MPYTLTARTGALLIIGAGFLWGTIGAVTKSLHEAGIGAISIGFLRFAVAAGVLIAYSITHAEWRSLLVHQWRSITLITANGLLLALSQTTYMASVLTAGITIATLVTICLAPLAVAAFGILSGVDHPTRTTGMALLITLIGTVLLTIGSDTPIETAPNLTIGLWLAILAAISYAGVVLCGHRLSQTHHPLHINGLSFGIGALALGIGTMISGLQLPTTPTDWALILYLGLVPSVAAYALFVWAMRAVPATVASLLTLTEPLAAAVLASLLFGEVLSAVGWIGSALMCTGFLLTLKQPSA